MSDTTEIRHDRACISALRLVFVTKYCHHVFVGVTLRCRQNIFNKVCYDFGARLCAWGGEGDHVHLLIGYPPKVAVSMLVNSLKGVSSRLLRQRRPGIARHYWSGVLSSPSYFAASNDGKPPKIVRQYVEQQRTPGRVHIGTYTPCGLMRS